MNAIAERPVSFDQAVTYKKGEFHPFEAAGVEFLYLVPSGAIFGLEELSKRVMTLLDGHQLTREEMLDLLTAEGYATKHITEAIDELEQIEAITSGYLKPAHPQVPAQNFPLQRVVLNVTNQCNLACTYCYEYSDDRIAQPDGKEKFMSEEMAQRAVEMLIKESAIRRAIHVTFFGGETLLNFRVVKSTVEFAKQKAAEAGKYIEFSLTTNATLLTPEIIEFLSEHRVGVTVSIDGDRELNNRMRVFQNGQGSYDVIAPRIKELLKGHRTNSIGARVTLSSAVTEVKRIYRHLTEELGFDSVGFSPATASADRLYAIGPKKMNSVIDQFKELAAEYLEYALRDQQHGFTNVSDTLKELHAGISKAYPCGAGLGMLGVGTNGNIGLCHRFVDSPIGQMGNVQTGIDHGARSQFLKTHHLGAKYDCQTCWARPVCSGGCYHEAFVHYGDTQHANLHYCDWIRGWNDVCLKVYGEIAVRNPKFLDRFSQ